MNRRLKKRLPSKSQAQYSVMDMRHSPNSFPRATSDDTVGTLETPFQRVSNLYLGETIFTFLSGKGDMRDVMKEVRADGVNLCADPDIYERLVWNLPVDYIGQFPIVRLDSGQVRESGFLLKRIFDIVFSALILVLLSPVLLAIAIAIKLDSLGPVLYSSERVGKMGCVFRCAKFRTMVWDADVRRCDVIKLNERDGVLFKIADDPRVTRLGRFLRKYSLDELPQFFNVLCGDMSVVGPRPPLANEVREYNLSHLRRLDVLPGITGLWQVQARQDPSFDSYISLDLAYIEWWSMWLDFKIIVRTIGVVFSGTGC
jgi:exopolysaccharide biosynthesis polyprenyl glycosylphosphotransferase